MPKCLALKREALEGQPFWKKIPEGSNRKWGVVKLSEKEVSSLLTLIKEEGSFKRRYGNNGIENNASWQQIIFYGVVKRDNQFLIYLRGGDGDEYKEKRLYSKLSIGIGGHIEPFDNNLIDSLYRELDEELNFSVGGECFNIVSSRDFLDIDVWGIIKDDTNSVGRVHLGLVCDVNLVKPKLEVSIKEGENIWGKFVDIGGYKQIVDEKEVEPESWTKLLMSGMVRIRR